MAYPYDVPDYACEGHPERALTLYDLCEQREESPHEIIVQCVFCKEDLQRQEVYEFLHKELRVVYRDGNPYGVCTACLQFHSKIRRLRRYRSSVYGETLERRLKRQLCEVTIRCYICQKPLCPVEKQRHLETKEGFHDIAGVWNGRCLRCWMPPGAETEV
nr:E6 [synthetic construct]